MDAALLSERSGSEQRNFVSKDIPLPLTLPLRQTSVMPPLTPVIMEQPGSQMMQLGDLNNSTAIRDTDLRDPFEDFQAGVWASSSTGTLLTQSQAMAADNIVFPDYRQSQPITQS